MKASVKQMLKVSRTSTDIANLLAVAKVLVDNGFDSESIEREILEKQEQHAKENAFYQFLCELEFQKGGMSL